MTCRKVLLDIYVSTQICHPNRVYLQAAGLKPSQSNRAISAPWLANKVRPKPQNVLQINFWSANHFEFDERDFFDQ